MIQLQPEPRLNHAKNPPSVMLQHLHRIPKFDKKSRALEPRCANRNAPPSNLSILEEPLFQVVDNTNLIISPNDAPQYSRLYGIIVACDSVDTEYYLGHISEDERSQIFNRYKIQLREIMDNLSITRLTLDKFVRMTGCSSVQCLDELLDC